jgi:hypothetical protein
MFRCITLQDFISQLHLVPFKFEFQKFTKNQILKPQMVSNYFFMFNATPKNCCNRPKMVGIDTMLRN